MKRPWLVPLLPVYAAGVALRDRRIRNGSEPVRRLRWPVISIGNLSTGGTGKTPLAIVLAGLLTDRGLHVDVLSRGYGRNRRDAARVVPSGIVEEFGDEALLIARDGGVPVYVAPQRYDAGLLAEREFTGRCDSGSFAAHILDDGFQHRQLARDVDILLMNRADWEDSLLPAGNLREPLRAVRRAHIVAIPDDDPALEEQILRTDWRGAIWRLRRKMDVPSVSGPVVAFCGIARPEQFFAGIEAAGVRIAARVAFRDHHRYAEADLARLSSIARSHGAAAFITTEKDLVRVGGLAAALASHGPLKVARLRIEVEDAEAAVHSLVERLGAVYSHSRCEKI